MFQVSPETTSKYRPRKVSAVRQFPHGCGPNAGKLRPKSVEETSFPVRLENGKVAHADTFLAASNVAKETALSSLALEEPLNVPCSVEALIPEMTERTVSSTAVVLGNNAQITKLEVQQVMESVDVLEKNVEPEPKTVKLEVQQENEDKHAPENKIVSDPKKLKLEVLQVMEESADPLRFHDRHCYSKMYGPPRRRKASAIRQFPHGCGPNSGSIREDNNQPVLAAPTLNDKSLVGGERNEASKKISSPKSKTFYGEKKPILQQQEMAESSALVAASKNLLHAVESMPREKQSILIDVSPKVSGVENSFNREKSKMNQSRANDRFVNLSSSEKVVVADRKSSEAIKGKETRFDKSVLVRSNSDKNIRVQGATGHVQMKSSLQSGLYGKSLMKSGLNEFFVGSSSEKTLEACTVDQAVKNIQTKANATIPSHFIAKPQSGNKRKDEKAIRKENEINQDNSKKRKLTEMIPYKDYTPGKSDGSLTATGERVIIQALMAAQNCPWRNPKKRCAVSSDFIVPKSKITKEKRSVDKNCASNDIFSYKKKNKCLNVDDDSMLEENNELSITMTPFVPPESCQKGGANAEIVARHKVKRVLRLFQLICRKLLQGEESRTKQLGKIKRIDLPAASILKDNGEWVNSGEPIIGNVPGVEIGDEFHFRVELSIVGLHRPFQGGIDFTNKSGMLLATSIVASGGYQDDMNSSDVLIYSGSGGTSVAGGDKQLGDQKLERGNLSLKNSIGTRTPVRVIHGFKEKGSDSHDTKGKLFSTFTYDGLYQVESYWQEVGNHGFNVFKFQLRRMAGQPELALKELRRSAKLKVREGLCVKDISQGKEKMPIAVVNTIDNELPVSFKYITKSIYPSYYAKAPPRGCDCTDGCSDSEKCACAVKNGGEIPFNFNGAIVQAKPLIYECGPSCKCSLSCHNRVSQRGIRMQLEIFKTRGRGWGVRSLKSITSGTFICEYVGELLEDGDAELRTNDEYLFDIGHNYDDHSLWEDLPNLIPGLQSSAECDTVESVGFTIDAAEYGNVGRFINHSCSPNLYAQNVLYDHDDKRMPHIMFFAADNIPPLQELTYHYNYTLDQVRDSEGNIKQKACYCGSSECCGRLY
ncbi:histone-lysine N-methyltransferase, H3 lysine-9 specific SUVH6-like [Phalaenopsis equestris]|uniref:histone-lysine N-methyltransferase, H3 lysine-9 specific SUVH6-like n=1 Tax=Phalaenopsis equestris TaxID=78828 RepID=UPI0009E44F52|nr:histone-lysine N-methyltransferase, H3 lysine-9 specific SUVH6-like [Phalaenopsis equestris]